MEEQFSEGKDRETDRTGTGSIGMDTSQTMGFRPHRSEELRLGRQNGQTGHGLDGQQSLDSANRPASAGQPLGGFRPDQTGGASVRPAASEVHPSEATEDLRVIRSSE
jgi:hypothetical protein